MATAPTPERTAEFQRGVLQFLDDGAQATLGTLRGRSFKRVEILCRRHFDGASPQHIFRRLDWRVVQELFTFIWAKATENDRRHWAGLGEELYQLMEYLHDGPAVPSDDEGPHSVGQALYAD